MVYLLFMVNIFAIGQFAPQAGQIGSTAIHCDSSIFIEWAKTCSVNRGFQDISNQSLGLATSGDSSMVIGKAGNGVVSLGDGGSAIITFENPIKNGAGYDFAIFENSFSDTFLELAFVEVSSDGINYYRFPCTSLTQDTLQIDGFGHVDATKIDNFAGKYRAMYGTPFDLQQLDTINELDINSITHIKIIDVVGCIQAIYAQHDQFGHKINDPWCTPFPSSGFDLDAVGVINSKNPSEIINENITFSFSVFPNPVIDNINIKFFDINNEPIKISIIDILGSEVFNSNFTGKNNNKININVSNIKNGVYFIELKTSLTKFTQKIIINHE